MTGTATTRAFALSNFYALDRLDVPGREAKANLAGKGRAHCGPTQYADACAERLELAAEVHDLRFLPDATPVATSFAAMTEGGSTAPDLSPEERLALVLRYSYGLLRWEPFNDYKQHRAIPSPRSLYPLDLYVIATGPHGPEVHRYLPEYHALARCAGGTAPAGMAQGFAIVARLGLLPPYGELTPTLTSIEAGALGVQLGHAGRLVGWTLSLDPAHDPAGIRQALGIEHWSDCPAATLTVAGDDLAAAIATLPARRERVMVRASRADAMEAHRRLREYVADAEADGGPLPTEGQPTPCDRALPARTMAPTDASFLSVVARRSSGCRVGGLVGRPQAMPDGGLAALLADAAALARHRAHWDAPRIRLFMTVFNDRVFEMGDHEVCLDTEAFREIARADRSELHAFESFYEINFASLAATFTLACDLASPAAAAPAFFRHAHQRAGEIVQDLALAASASGMFARPYRSFRGPIHQSVLDMGCEPLLQIITGVSRRANPAFARIAR